MKKSKKYLLLTLLIPVLAALVVCAVQQKYKTRSLPVLMYHHFAEESSADTVVTPERFREQMTALRETGFTTVTVQQMLDYVQRGTPLPEKPVLITMDDGYTSNLTIAAPILEELGLCATVFVIGVYEGETYSVHTGEPLYPDRFSYEEAKPWVDKGVLDLQSHSFDLHRLDGSAGEGMLPLPGENEDAYEARLEADMAEFCRQREGQVGTPLLALSFPYGYYTEETDDVLEDLGIALTFTVKSGCSRLEMGEEDSLRCMSRFNVTNHMSGKALVQLLTRALD